VDDGVPVLLLTLLLVGPPPPLPKSKGRPELFLLEDLPMMVQIPPAPSSPADDDDEAALLDPSINC